MAKEISIGKRAKISEAQQYMLLAVLGASIFLGVAVSLVVHFIKQISFNTNVIMAEDQAIDAYSSVIESVGICEKPQAKAYSESELKACDPDSIEVSSIPGTLRANILENLAADKALWSVPEDQDSKCINSETGKKYTYEELSKMYNDAEGPEQLAAASSRMKSCSALRIIPDALPASKNEEGLFASITKILLLSGREPDGLAPPGANSLLDLDLDPGLHAIDVSFSIDDASTETTTLLLTNIERSIREFNIESATISWSSDTTLSFQAQATAFYRDKSSIVELQKTIKAEDN